MPNNKSKLIKKKKSGKKVAPLPDIIKNKNKKEKVKNVLFEKKAKNFSIGQCVQPKRDLTRFVKWPRYVRLQKSRSIMKKRLKMPPQIYQFNDCAVDKANTKSVLSFLKKYKPETHEEKMARLKLRAAQRVEGSAEKVEDKPATLAYGVREVTKLITSKKAQMVVISHDVDPIELVIHLPGLCRKMDVPCAIIKGKANLGQLVGMKTCSAVALKKINQDDRATANKLFEMMRNNLCKEKLPTGGGIMGLKSQAKMRKREKIAEKGLL